MVVEFLLKDLDFSVRRELQVVSQGKPWGLRRLLWRGYQLY
jgi:hypothetical protein